MSIAQVFWLQYKDSDFAYLMFEETGEHLVRVAGPLGAATYIDKVMSRVDARAYWREMVAKGYHRIEKSKAPSRHVHMDRTYGR